MNKKGAVEFSITTIIVIIVGITILALALPWVSRMMGQTGELTDSAVDQARTQLAGELGASNPVVVAPSSLTMGSNQESILSVGCFNNGNDAESATLGAIDDGTNFGVTQSADSSSDIAVGGEHSWAVVLKGINSITSADTPEIISLVVECGGGPVTKPVTITYR